MSDTYCPRCGSKNTEVMATYGEDNETGFAIYNDYGGGECEYHLSTSLVLCHSCKKPTIIEDIHDVC
tara:strand:+ start:8925 stop:9125 length:201 start_codon:yes stop_codon:yes gene_type:complete